MMFGCFMACTFFVMHIDDLAEDGLTGREWLGLIMFCAAVGIALGCLYYPINKFLRKRGLSLHDEKDFDDE